MKLVSAGLCVLYSDLRCGNLQFTLTITGIFLEGKGARLNAVNFSATNSINVPFTTLKAKWCPNYKHCNITKIAFCSQWETKTFILGLKLTLSKLPQLSKKQKKKPCIQ